MPIADDLQEIAAQVHRELDAVHDYFEHSKIVWRSFQMLVDQGQSANFQNTATDTVIDEHGLLALAPHYTRKYLATFTFRQCASALEVFLFNFLHRLLLQNPWQFAKNQLEFEFVLQAGDRDEIISGFILKRLNDLKYGNLREWFVALNKASKLDCPSDDEIDSLAEIKASRDILEHNAGVVNEIYLRKAGNKARFRKGDQIQIDDVYLQESWQLIKQVVSAVAAAGVAKFSKA